MIERWKDEKRTADKNGEGFVLFLFCITYDLFVCFSSSVVLLLVV